MLVCGKLKATCADWSSPDLPERDGDDERKLCTTLIDFDRDRSDEEDPSFVFFS